MLECFNLTSKEVGKRVIVSPAPAQPPSKLAANAVRREKEEQGSGRNFWTRRKPGAKIKTSGLCDDAVAP